MSCVFIKQRVECRSELPTNVGKFLATIQHSTERPIMGFWSSLFSGSTDSGDVVKVRESTSNTDHVRGDKFTPTGEQGGKEHTHRSYDVDRSSGAYKEYGGGEKSDDRSYNKH